MKKSSYFLKHFISEIVVWKNGYEKFCILHLSKDHTVGPIAYGFNKPNKYILYKIKNYEN